MADVRVNPYAPPALSGLAGTGPAGYVDMDFSYVYAVTLTGGQFLRDQSLAVMTDADFLWRALMVTSNTGNFSIRFSDSQGTYLSNGMLLNQNFFLGNLAQVFPILPQVVIPAGGRIGIDIQDLSGAGNTIQLTFRGVKRYRLPQGA